MTKNQFLNKLKIGLFLRLPYKQAKETITQYREFFEENKDRTEEELVAECGDIDLIIAENSGNHLDLSWINVRLFCILLIMFMNRTVLDRGLLNYGHADFDLFTSIVRLIAAFILVLVSVFVIGRKHVTKSVETSKMVIVFAILNVIFVALAQYIVSYELFDVLISPEYDGEHFILNYNKLAFSLIPHAFNILAFLALVATIKYGKTAFKFFIFNIFSIHSIMLMFREANWIIDYTASQTEFASRIFEISVRSFIEMAVIFIVVYFLVLLTYKIHFSTRKIFITTAWRVIVAVIAAIFFYFISNFSGFRGYFNFELFFKILVFIIVSVTFIGYSYIFEMKNPQINIKKLQIINISVALLTYVIFAFLVKISFESAFTSGYFPFLDVYIIVHIMYISIAFIELLKFGKYAFPLFIFNLFTAQTLYYSSYIAEKNMDFSAISMEDVNSLVFKIFSTSLLSMSLIYIAVSLVLFLLIKILRKVF